MARYIGLDVGSVSVDLVVVDRGADGPPHVIESRYVRTYGRALPVTIEQLREVIGRHADIAGLAVTGSGGKIVAELLGVPFINEIVAQSKATLTLHPGVRTIIEIGGEDSKLIRLETDGDGRPRVSDFALNSICAAGTGSFLDQ